MNLNRLQRVTGDSPLLCSCSITSLSVN